MSGMEDALPYRLHRAMKTTGMTDKQMEFLVGPEGERYLKRMKETLDVLKILNHPAVDPTSSTE